MKSKRVVFALIVILLAIYAFLPMKVKAAGSTCPAHGATGLQLRAIEAVQEKAANSDSILADCIRRVGRIEIKIDPLVGDPNDPTDDYLAVRSANGDKIALLCHPADGGTYSIWTGIHMPIRIPAMHVTELCPLATVLAVEYDGYRYLLIGGAAQTEPITR